MRARYAGVIRAAALFGCILAARTAEAKLVLDRIVVHGASKTSEGAVEARMRLHRGDVIEYGILGVAEDRLVASDLFQSVRVYLDTPRDWAVQLMYLSDKTYSIDVHVEVKEKHSWFIIPNFAVGGGDVAGGLVYADMNLAGTGSQLISAGQVGKLKSFGFVGFRDPIATFAPITYSTAGIFRQETFLFYGNGATKDDVVQQVGTRIAGGEAQVGYVFSSHMKAIVGGMYNRQWLRNAEDKIAGYPEAKLYNAPATGCTVSATDATPAPEKFCNGENVVTLQLYFDYDRTIAPEGLRRGAKVKLHNEVSDNFWGSDYDYAKLEFQGELYGYVAKTYPSVNFRTILNFPTSERGVPLTQLLRLGGGDLRGYNVNQFNGDTLMVAQFEDQIPVIKGLKVPLTSVKLNLAVAGFVDVGALLDRHPGGRIDPLNPSAKSRPTLDDFHTSAGVGVRILVPGVAIPAVKIDYGYGFDRGAGAIAISVAGGGL